MTTEQKNQAILLCLYIKEITPWIVERASRRLVIYERRMNVNKNEHTSTTKRSICGTTSSSAPL